jgi:hypothetical protein
MVGSLLKLELADIDDYGLGVCDAACTGLQCFKLENLCNVTAEAMRQFLASCSDTLIKLEFGDEDDSNTWDWGLDTTHYGVCTPFMHGAWSVGGCAS